MSFRRLDAFFSFISEVVVGQFLAQLVGFLVQVDALEQARTASAPISAVKLSSPNSSWKRM